jgi:hypothetical protein
MSDATPRLTALRSLGDPAAAACDGDFCAIDQSWLDSVGPTEPVPVHADGDRRQGGVDEDVE